MAGTIKEPIIVDLKLQVKLMPDGTAQFVPPSDSKPVENSPFTDETQVTAVTNSNFLFLCHCADHQIHMYYFDPTIGVWLDFGHIGAPCTC